MIALFADLTVRMAICRKEKLSANCCFSLSAGLGCEGARKTVISG
jgi:hypothetical protein